MEDPTGSARVMNGEPASTFQNRVVGRSRPRLAQPSAKFVWKYWLPSSLARSTPPVVVEDGASKLSPILIVELPPASTSKLLTNSGSCAAFFLSFLHLHCKAGDLAFQAAFHRHMTFVNCLITHLDASEPIAKVSQGRDQRSGRETQGAEVQTADEVPT